MCGISGIVFSDTKRQPGHALLNSMSSLLVHRGPDGHGRHVAPGIGLDFRRLSIIDLETGNQPLYNEDRSIVLVLNGEIYNYIELRSDLQARGHCFSTHSDAEVALHLYEEKGLDFLHGLRGMFGLALWDAGRRRLVLARDRLGIKPLYYWLCPSKDLLFASEIKAILASGKVRAEIEPQALKDIFTQGFVNSPGTMFRNIRQLEPGQVLSYQAGDVSVRQYWDLVFPEAGREDGRSAGAWSEELAGKLRETVALHMRSDVAVGTWLSPGLDSSSIAALMLEASEETVNAYTLIHNAKGGMDETLRCSTLDSYHAARFAARRIYCDKPHIELYTRSIWHRESPTSSTLHIAQMQLSEAASREVKVVLTGEGADENFGGYPWYILDKLLRPFSLLPQSLRAFLGRGFNLAPRYRWMQRMFDAPREDRERFQRMVGLDDQRLSQRLISKDFRVGPDAGVPSSGPERWQTWHPFQKMQYIETKTRLSDYITHNLDRASMSYGLEVRVPFLDHELVELSSRIPVALKMKGFREKYVLRRAMEPYLPREIAWRRKCAFAAADKELFAGRLPDALEQQFSRASIRDKGYFDPDLVARMRAEHQKGGKDHSRPLAAVLGVQIWDDLFVRDFTGRVEEKDQS